MYFTHLNLEYDEDILKLYFENSEYYGFKCDPSTAQHEFFIDAPDWQVCKNTEHIDEVNKVSTQVQNLFDANVNTQFFKQLSGCEVPVHYDPVPKCSVNILLSKNNSPITFENIGDVHYKCALLNTKKKHMIRSSETDRWLLILSIMDKTYEECIQRLENECTQ